MSKFDFETFQSLQLTNIVIYYIKNENLCNYLSRMKEFEYNASHKIFKKYRFNDEPLNSLLVQFCSLKIIIMMINPLRLHLQG